MEYYNNILCVEGGWLYCEGEIMSKPSYDKLKVSNQVTIVRRGCKGTPALIAYDSIPSRFQKIIIDKWGDPYRQIKKQGFSDRVIIDNEAMDFFQKYRIPSGDRLPEKTLFEYVNNASILNCIHILVSNARQMRKAMGNKNTGMWNRVAEIVDEMKDEYNHSLPLNHVRLKEKYTRYMQEGYTCLIHKGFCNDNSRKVSDRLEQLILSLYVQPNKPYSSSVHDMYLQFLAGKLDVVDCRSGEIYDRNDFFDRNGIPIMISETTVWNYINDPKNRALVDKKRTGGLEYSSTHRPHVHRRAPDWALSKVSMDDQDLGKMPDGRRVKAYRVYDVKSRVMIGVAYSKDKDTTLFIDCMRNMFLFLKRNGLGTPLEVEVEHHLVNCFKDDLMKAGIVFPFIRWCRPGNSQEKYAETGHRVYKYGFEKKYNDGVGRFYAKREADRPKVDKVFDENNNTYKDKVRTFEEIVATDLEIIEKYNNSEHPKKKIYPDMTRMDVLLSKVNPDLAQLDAAIFTRYIGNKTTTSIQRSQYISLNYEKYVIESPELLGKLEPNNYTVDCYWLPDHDGTVYIYQNDIFISSCMRIELFNTATAEHTDRDREILVDQQKYIARFDKMVKSGSGNIPKVKIFENTDALTSTAPVKTINITPNQNPEPVEIFDTENNGEYYRELGADSL